MKPQEIFAHLRQFDTPTICNALEIASGKRDMSGFTRQTLIAASPTLPSIIGYARTATIRCSTPYDANQRRENQLSYYKYVAKDNQPSIAVIQDIDETPGLGAFWGEVNTHIHWGLGCVGTLTNGSMRDLDAMQKDFQCLAGSLSPSHAWVQVAESGQPVEIFGMSVADNDIVHADRHGATIIPADLLDKIPAAIDLMARREKVLLDASRRSDFNFSVLQKALAESASVQ